MLTLPDGGRFPERPATVLPLAAYSTVARPQPSDAFHLMLRLSTFGGLVLQEDGHLHTGPASQRRRVALLAVVASSGRRGISREKLLSLLWPGGAADSGRHSLYQALHAIRKSLGSDDVFLGAATLQLNPELISSDVGEFEEAVEQGAHERVTRL